MSNQLVSSPLITPSTPNADAPTETPLDGSLVSIEGFEAYLRDNLETEYLGRDIEKCPIARYLQHLYNKPDLRASLHRAFVKVRKDDYVVEVGVLYYVNEHDWISSFVVRFDSTWDKRSPLNGSDALEVLERVKAQRSPSKNEDSSNSLKQDEATTGKETTETLQG